MRNLEARLARLEATMHHSERKISLGEFGFATLTELRALMVTIAAQGANFVETRLDQRVATRED